jgi:hypothetical protein
MAAVTQGSDGPVTARQGPTVVRVSDGQGPKNTKVAFGDGQGPKVTGGRASSDSEDRVLKVVRVMI